MGEVKGLQVEEASLFKELVLIWEKFCKLHHRLYDITCREYQLLLASRIDAIDENIKDKVSIINEIKGAEIKRREFVDQLSTVAGCRIGSSRELLSYVENNLQEYREEGQLLKKYNKILVETIENIQFQNKKNQTFINKAMHNLRNIREGVLGQSGLGIYDARGRQQQQSA